MEETNINLQLYDLTGQVSIVDGIARFNGNYSSVLLGALNGQYVRRRCTKKTSILTLRHSGCCQSHQGHKWPAKLHGETGESPGICAGWPNDRPLRRNYSEKSSYGDPPVIRTSIRSMALRMVLLSALLEP
jgi:hypothetical protein